MASIFQAAGYEVPPQGSRTVLILNLCGLAHAAQRHLESQPAYLRNPKPRAVEIIARDLAPSWSRSCNTIACELMISQSMLRRDQAGENFVLWMIWAYR